MKPNWHPSDDQLTRFITVDDDSEEAKCVSEHLESCESCLGRLAIMDQERGFSSILAVDHVQPEIPSSVIEKISEAVRSEHLPISYPSLTGSHTLSFQEFFDRGGMGDVLIYRDIELDRNLVLKTLRHDLGQSQYKRKRFAQEKLITSQLRLPGVPEVYGSGILPDGREYFCMQFIEGGKLSQHIREFHKQKPKLIRSNEKFLTLLRTFVTICRTLESAHQQHVIHRDLKSSNVLIGKNNFPYVIDWGLAGEYYPEDDPLESEAGSSSNRLSRYGLKLGTPYSWAPEQATGQIEKIDAVTDIYGLGSILFELLTDTLLHARASDPSKPTDIETNSPVTHKEELDRIIAELKNGVIRNPRSINRSIPTELASICIRATQPKREDRYQTAGELADDLDAWIACLPVKAHQYNLVERINRWITASPSRAATTLVSIFLIGLLSTLFSSVAYTLKKKAEANEELAQSAVRDGLTTLRSVINIANDNQRPDTDELRDIQSEMVTTIEKGIETTASRAFDEATRLETAILLGKLGDIHTENSQPQNALKIYSKAIHLFEVEPEIAIENNTDASILFAELQCSRAISYIACKHRDEAATTVSQALDCINQIPEQDLAKRNKLSLSLYMRRMYANALFRNWDRNTLYAHDSAKDTLKFCDQMLERWPRNDEVRLERAELLAFIGLCIHKSGGFEKEMLTRYEECSKSIELVRIAQNFFDQALMTLDTVTQIEKTDDAYLNATVSILTKKALSDSRISQERSRETYKLCLEVLRQFSDKYPFSRERKLELAVALSEYADQHYPDSINRAIDLRRESLDILSEFTDSDSPRIRDVLSHNTVRYARDLAVANRRNEATELVTNIYRRYGTLHYGLPIESEFLGYALIYANPQMNNDPKTLNDLGKLAAEYLNGFDKENVRHAKDLLNWLKTYPECRALANEPQVRAALDSLDLLATIQVEQ